MAKEKKTGKAKSVTTIAATLLLAGTMFTTGTITAYAHDDHVHEEAVVSETVETSEVDVNDEFSEKNSFMKLLETLVSPAEASGNAKVWTQGNTRYISANGIPDHATGQFPNSGNPHSISAQNYDFKIPTDPTKNSQPTSATGLLFGVALNGVPFDPATAEFWDNGQLVRGTPTDWNYEAIGGAMNLGLDSSNAHVQPNGAYHYHGIPNGVMDQFKHTGAPLLIGYAADGFPIYGPYGYSDADDATSNLEELHSSYQLKQGERPSDAPDGSYDGTFTADFQYVAGTGDLDQCNGRTGVTAEYPDGTYYYVLTEDFPFVPRCLWGDVDSSFDTKRGGQERAGAPSGHQGPQFAMRNGGPGGEPGFEGPSDGQGPGGKRRDLRGNDGHERPGFFKRLFGHQPASRF